MLKLCRNMIHCGSWAQLYTFESSKSLRPKGRYYTKPISHFKASDSICGTLTSGCSLTGTNNFSVSVIFGPSSSGNDSGFFSRLNNVTLTLFISAKYEIQSE